MGEMDQCTKYNCEDFCYLSDWTVENLHKQGVKDLFPVQKVVIPEILRRNSKKSIFPPRDVCVSAPTGSGKTLSYVLPIVENLKDRNFHRIGALVVVPVVNLAKQVFQVFRTYSTGTNLRTVLITGKQNFGQECTELYEKLPNVGQCASNSSDFSEIATADIVVATPGRLLDHLRSNGSKFCLKFLSFLVMDEADRLMNDFRSDWLNEVEYAVYDSTFDADTAVIRHRIKIENLNQLLNAGQMPLQKILLSATLSHNPEEIKRLNLFFPKYLSISSQGESDEFTATKNTGIPGQLKQFCVKIDLKYKPLAVFNFVQKDDYKKILCFVAKRDSSRKLAHVLQKLNAKNVSDISSICNKYRMHRVLDRFRKAQAGVLICTDVMARGIDIDKIDCVINYDCPKFLRTYVHRVGRTARADAQGSAITLVESIEAEDFYKMLAENSSPIVEIQLKEEELKKYDVVYKQALDELKKEAEAENAKNRNKIHHWKRKASSEGFRNKKAKHL